MKIRTIFLSAAATALILGEAVAQTSLPSTAAASVYEFIPGPRSTLYAINEYSAIPGHAFDSYVYFDLASLGYSSGSDVVSATLRLYTDANTAAGFMTGFGVPVPASSDFTISDAAQNWVIDDEPDPNLNWSNRPLSGDEFLAAQTFEFRSDPEGGYSDYWIEIDVTELVRYWVDNPAGNFGFRLSTPESPFSAAAFAGNSAGSFAPNLLITAVPEPSAWALGVGAFSLLTILLRRKFAEGNR